jgi:hypothetical protein
LTEGLTNRCFVRSVFPIMFSLTLSDGGKWLVSVEGNETYNFTNKEY